MNLRDSLFWLQTGPGVVTVAMFLSWLGEKIPQFKEWNDSNGKMLVMAGLSVATAVAAWAIYTFVPQPALDQLDPVFQVVVLSITTLLGNQIYHKWVNKSDSSKGSTSVTIEEGGKANIHVAEGAHVLNVAATYDTSGEVTSLDYPESLPDNVTQDQAKSPAKEKTP